MRSESLARTSSKRQQAFFFGAASGSFVLDRSGTKYFDLTSGWNVINAGWNNVEIVTEWKRGLDDLSFRPSWCTDVYKQELLETLARIAPGYSPISSCSGSEAVDNALKIARLVTGRAGVVSIVNAYHGSTLGAAMASGYDVAHLEPLGVENRRFHIPTPITDDAIAKAEQIIRASEDIGAVVLETVLTNAGCYEVPQKFLTLVARLSEELDFLLVCDEIGTGLNRTGGLFSFIERGLRPDIYVVGKALTNGLYPLSIAMVTDRLLPYIDHSEFASTYGGTTSGCAAALATLAFHDKNNLGAKALEIGAEVKRRFEANTSGFPCVTGVFGAGLELAVHFDWQSCRAKGLSAKTLVQDLLSRSLFSVLSPDSSQLMFMPPLTSELDDVIRAVDTICEIVCT